MGANERTLLVCLALLGSTSASAQFTLQDYTGPNVAPVVIYTINPAHAATYCPAMDDPAVIPWNNIAACMDEYRDLVAPSYGPDTTVSIRWCASTPTLTLEGWNSCTTGDFAPTNPPVLVARNIWGIIQVTGPGSTYYASAGVFGTDRAACEDASGHDVATIDGVSRCVSKCYSVRGTDVSLFVPIDSEAATVNEACFFISGRGSCQVQTVSASNYSYGGQLYRAGTFRHVGQRCTEKTGSPVTTGAISQAPTGTASTGAGLSSADSAKLTDIKVNTGNTVSELQGMRAETKSRLDDLKALSNDLIQATDGAGAISGSTAGLTSIEAAKNKNVDELQKNADMLTLDQAPTMGGDGSRWKIGLDPFVGSAAACTHTWVANFPKMAPKNLTLDICKWAPYFQGFMFWALGIWTAWSLWSTIYAHARQA